MADQNTTGSRIADRLMSIANRMGELGDGEDDETVAKRAKLYLEAAAFNGWLALATMPDARNYIATGLRFDDADDPMHAAVDIEIRWRGGKLTSEAIAEMKATAKRLESEWREMKRERDDARQHGDDLAAAVRRFIRSPVAQEDSLARSLDAYTAARGGDA